MENKLFGAVKLEDLEGASGISGEAEGASAEEGTKTRENAEASAEGVETKPVMGVQKIGTEGDIETGAEKTEARPMMGVQKTETEPEEIIVPKMPGEKKAEEKEFEQNETAFRMDMLVEADETIDASKGIFSGAPVEKKVTPIESANSWHDKTNFKDKTATHAERVFETDQAIREEQEKREQEETAKEAEEKVAKRVNEAWDANQKKSAEKAPEKDNEESTEKAQEEAMKTGPKNDDTPAGIFTVKPKSNGLSGFFGKIKNVLTKPVGKKK